MKPCVHDRKVCYDCAQVSDEAKRCYDIVNSYVAFMPPDQLKRSWVAIRLSDGGHDGNLYQSKRDAVRKQSNEFQCAYFSYRNSPGGFANKKEAQVFLDFNRLAYDAGFRLADPDDRSGGKELIMPVANEDTFRFMNILGRK